MRVLEASTPLRVAHLAVLPLVLLASACDAPPTQRPGAGVFQLTAVTVSPRAAASATPPRMGGGVAEREPSVTPPPAGSGAGRPPGGVAISVRDRQGLAVPGATVLFANGASFRTGSDGALVLPGPVPQAACVVFAPGHKTSVVAGAGLPEVLHLDRQPSADRAFEPGEITVRGMVAWADPAIREGVVLYQDDLGGVANPVVVDGDGRFALRIETHRAGSPSGVILALAAGTPPQFGVSRVFNAAAQGDELVAIAAVRATRTVAFGVASPPAGLNEVSHRLEIAVEGLAPFRLMGLGATMGEYRVPAAGALGATVRIAVEAANSQAGTRSVVTLDPDAMPSTPPTFLAVPAVSVKPERRTASWTIDAAASAVLLELTEPSRLDEPYWEGWFEGRSEHRFEARDWPSAPSALARLVAFDAPEASARRVASARQLRVLPEPGWRGGFRFAEARVPFVTQ